MTTLNDFHKTPSDDGKTHINVYSKGETAIGRHLSHFAHTPFQHPELGFFTSMEGLWYYLKTLDDSLRDLSGFDAKKIGRELPVKQLLSQDEFQRLINKGNEAKIRQHPEILMALAQTTLPLTHYYVTKGYGAKPADSEWILACIERVRVELNPEADTSNTRYCQERQAQHPESEPQGSLF